MAALCLPPLSSDCKTLSATLDRHSGITENVLQNTLGWIRKRKHRQGNSVCRTYRVQWTAPPSLKGRLCVLNLNTSGGHRRKLPAGRRARNERGCSITFVIEQEHGHGNGLDLDQKIGPVRKVSESRSLGVSRAVRIVDYEVHFTSVAPGPTTTPRARSPRRPSPCLW